VHGEIDRCIKKHFTEMQLWDDNDGGKVGKGQDDNSAEAQREKNKEQAPKKKSEEKSSYHRLNLGTTIDQPNRVSTNTFGSGNCANSWESGNWNRGSSKSNARKLNLGPDRRNFGGMKILDSARIRKHLRGKTRENVSRIVYPNSTSTTRTESTPDTNHPGNCVAFREYVRPP